MVEGALKKSLKKKDGKIKIKGGRKMINKHYRHGDILLIKIDELPENIRFKTKRDKIILEGEVTGHAHRLKGNAKILEDAERIINPPPTGFPPVRNIPIKSQVIGYAVVKEPTELIHEEHNTITLPVGTYEIRRQREYDSDYIKFVED